MHIPFSFLSHYKILQRGQNRHLRQTSQKVDIILLLHHAQRECRFFFFFPGTLLFFF